VSRTVFPARRRKIIELHRRWRKACNRYELVIENKGSGMSLIQDLRDENIHAIKVDPEGDKKLCE
jgi:phage terminase large subunit-like protein